MNRWRFLAFSWRIACGRQHVGLWASALCFTFAANSSSHSQTAKNLAGTISDTQSVPIPYARIVVYSEANGITKVVHVDSKGNFELHLTPGMYDVMAAARSFSPVSARIELPYGKAAN